MTRDELRNLIIEAESLIKKLRKVWRVVEDIDIQKATETIHLPCDSCGEEEEDN